MWSIPRASLAREGSVTKKKGPEYLLMLFTRENCAPCKVAKPQVEKASSVLGVDLELIDVFSEKGEKLLLPFNILSVPTLVALKDGKKWQEFAGAKDLTEKHLVERLTKLIAKESAQ
jgi:thioredoxin-like negative regulator of GroEL